MFDPVLHSFLDDLVFFSLRREDCQTRIKIVSRIIQIVTIHDHQTPHRPLGSGLLLRYQGCCPGPNPDPTIFCKYLQILTNICKHLQMCKKGLGPNVCLSPPSGNIAIIALKMSLRNAPLYQTLQFFLNIVQREGEGGKHM